MILLVYIFSFFILGVFRFNSTTNTTTFNCLRFSNGFKLSSWDQVNIVFYIAIPFLVMFTFNSLLILNIKRRLNNQESNKSAAKRRNLTISLLVLCFLFIVMTAPATILFAYFYQPMIDSIGLASLYMIDDISFLNNSMLFFVCFISNRKFRKTVFKLCGWCKV